MRGNELLDKMELIDSVYVEAADAMPKRRRAAWLRWCAAAACLSLLAIAGIELPRQELSGRARQKVQKYGYHGRRVCHGMALGI